MTKIDTKEMSLKLTQREDGPYDGILISTGASAFIPPFAGVNAHSNILSVRTAGDAVKLRKAIDSGRVKKGLVIGASMVGIKVAEAFLRAGISCAMVDTAPYIFPLAAFEPCARRVVKILDELGITQLYNVGVTSVEEAGGRLLAHFNDGGALEADTIVMCVGTNANTGPAQGTDILIKRGIVVDKSMRSSIPGVFAAGDCCEAEELQSGQRKGIGLWANAGYQGRTAGEAMTGKAVRYDLNLLYNITRFFDWDFISMGDVSACSEKDESWEHEGNGLYVRAHRECGTGRLKCINLLGSSRCGGVLRNYLMRSFAGAGKGVDAFFIAALEREGFPEGFIRWILR